MLATLQARLILAAVLVALGFGAGFYVADHLAAGRIERLAADVERERGRADENARAERARDELCRRGDAATTRRDQAVDEMERRLRERQREIDNATGDVGDDVLDRAVGGGGAGERGGAGGGAGRLRP